MRAESGHLTWWGAAGIELEVGGRRLAIDPYLYPRDAVDYVCVTHNDYDHCHDPTLERLTNDPRFKRLIVPRSALVKSLLDSPLHDGSQDLPFVDPDRVTVMYPKYTRDPTRRFPAPTELELDGFAIEAVDSSERPYRYKRYPSSKWQLDDGPFVGRNEFPNNGYVISAGAAPVVLYHPGDLSEVFDAHRLLRGRVDVMFMPLMKLEGLELTIVDTIRPRWIVPIHYRDHSRNYPVPLDITQEDLELLDLATGRPAPGGDPVVWQRENEAMSRAHWFPTGDPPLSRLHEIEPAIEALGTRVKILEAGSRLPLQALCA